MNVQRFLLVSKSAAILLVALNAPVMQDMNWITMERTAQVNLLLDCIIIACMGTHTHAHTHTHTHTQTHTRTYTRTYTHTNTHTNTHTCMLTCIHTTHAMYTYMHAYIYMHM